MQSSAKRTILVTLSFIVIGVLAFTAYQADQAASLPPAADWDQITQGPTFEHETLFIEAPDARLEADLFVPTGGGEEKSAVIFITGSGDTLYQDYGDGLIKAFVLDVFLPRDAAVLLINKRGMGQSSSSWLNNDFQGRVEDIYAGVRFLQELDGIDPQNIGVIGHSQGGWIANLVAAQHEDVAFFISLAGPTTPVTTQMEDTYRNVFACEGSQGEALEKRTANQLRLSRLGAAVGRVLPFGVIGFDAGIIDYDPADALSAVQQPGLFAYGEHDPFVPPDSSLDRLRALFGEDLPENLEFVTIPQANHRFKVVDSLCASPEEAQAAGFSPDLTVTLNTWLEQIGR